MQKIYNDFIDDLPEEESIFYPILAGLGAGIIGGSLYGIILLLTT